jgi:hypothetical protein
MKLLQLQWLRSLAFAGLMLPCGCSLLSGESANAPATPPMMGAAAPDEPAPKARQKYRFATEVANTRKDHLAAQRRAAAQSAGATEAIASPQIAARARRPLPPSPDPSGAAYPETGVNSFAATAVSAPFLTQRLPDVRQASFGDPPAF